MSEVIYPVEAGTLPQGSCPATYQELADLLATVYSVTVNTSNTGIIVSATKPADTTAAWMQLDSGGRPVRQYIFVGGLWLSRHTMEPGEIVLWRGSIANLWSFDGGDGTDPDNPATAPTVISGAMWREVTELRARVPLGVGTLPSGLAVAADATGGSENVTLDTTQIPAHTHSLNDNPADNKFGRYNEADGNENPWGSGNQGEFEGEFPFSTQSTGGGLAHTNMPPYMGIYFIERTDRVYFTVS